MNILVHPAGVMLRGDERYNPRFTREPEYRADGGSRITGVMRPDSPEGVAANPTLPELPFRFIVPADADYTPINVEVWRRLQSGETLWDLNFAPSSNTLTHTIDISHAKVRFPYQVGQQSFDAEVEFYIGELSLGKAVLSVEAVVSPGPGTAHMDNAMST